MNVPAKLPQREPSDYAIDIFVRGDFAKFSPEEEAQYLRELCHSLGLNAHTRPFEFINFQGRRIPYARKDCTEQLRRLRGVSVTDLSSVEREGIFLVTAKVRDKEGREDVATGAVSVSGLKGDALANALMKAETKAKRRATLSICGLGFLDESELDETPEKLTRPAQVHSVSVSKADGLTGTSPRIERADEHWREKVETWTLEVQQTKTLDDLDKWISAHSVEASSIPTRHKELQQFIYRTVRLHRERLIAGQTVHEEDGDRQATEADFEPAPLPPEPQAGSISQRAIHARENPSADEIADYLRS